MAQQPLNPCCPYCINTLQPFQTGAIALSLLPQLEMWSSVSVFEGSQVLPDIECFPISFSDFSSFPQGRERIPPCSAVVYFSKKSQDETLFAHSQQRFRYDTVPRTEPAEELMGGQAVGMEQKGKKWGKKGSKGLVKQNWCSSYGLSSGKHSKTQWVL